MDGLIWRLSAVSSFMSNYEMREVKRHASRMPPEPARGVVSYCLITGVRRVDHENIVRTVKDIEIETAMLIGKNGMLLNPFPKNNWTSFRGAGQQFFLKCYYRN